MRSCQRSAVSDQLPFILADCTSTVILSGAQRSGEIPALSARTVRPVETSLSAFHQEISPFHYVPVEKTVVNETDLIRNKVKQIYTAEIGVREATGKNDGKRVEEYLAITNLGKGYAWCAAFISWVFAEADFPQPRTPWSPALFPKERVIWERGKGKLSAISNRPSVSRDLRSFALLKDDKVDLRGAGYEESNPSSIVISTAAQRSGEISLLNAQPIPNPKTADIFGIYFANLKRIAHAGLVDEWGDKYVVTVEGNTNEAGSNEGDGVYRKRRLISSIYQVADWVTGQERRVDR